MKLIEAKCPGVVTLTTERHNDDYLARRDYVDTNNKAQIILLKESRTLSEETFNPILHAGLLFFKELGIKGYKLVTHIERRIKTGLGLLEDEVMATAAIKALNQLCDTHLTDDELAKLGMMISKKIPSLLKNETVIVNQDEEIVNSDPNSRDCFYNLISLGSKYDNIDLTKFFLNEEIDLDKNDNRYKELMFLKSFMEDNYAKHISMNSNNIIISSYPNVHDRFKVYHDLKEQNYYVTQLNRGNGITMLKMYK